MWLGEGDSSLGSVWGHVSVSLVPQGAEVGAGGADMLRAAEKGPSLCSPTYSEGRGLKAL